MKRKTFDLSGRRVEKLIASFILMLSIVQLILIYQGQDNLSLVLSYIIVGLSFILLLLFFSPWLFLICIGKKQKERCPFIDKADCPYKMKRECRYDTTNCISFPNKNIRSWRRMFLLMIFVTAITFYTLSLNKIFGGEKSTVNSLIQTISLSVITASVVSFLVDLPGRMKEYQSYFVSLLSSSEYLKQLDENELNKLRERITWIQHLKILPKMSEGMVKIDHKICSMLFSPYYRNYTQLITLSKGQGNKPLIKKAVEIEYTVFNPYGETKPIPVDIGISNSMFIEALQNDNPSISKEDVKNYLKMREFTLSFDEKSEEIDILPLISMRVVKIPEEGLKYNGNIYLVWENPLELDSCPNREAIVNLLKQNSNMDNTDSILSRKRENHLKVMLEKRIKVKVRYDLTIPENDFIFTKRLRYPVHDFTIDYQLGNNMSGYELSGQILGTLLDQSDIITHYPNPDDKQRILLRTTDWLLQRDGAIIVHNKNIS